MSDKINLHEFAHHGNHGHPRRVRKAIEKRDYQRASYYDADHYYRYGKRAWEVTCTYRIALGFG